MFVQLASAFNLAVNNRYRSVTVSTSRSNLTVIKILYDQGFIVNYSIVSGSIRFTLNYGVLFRMKLFPKFNTQTYITFKRIKSEIIYNGRFVLIRTSSGRIVSASHCYFQRVGGYPLIELAAH